MTKIYHFDEQLANFYNQVKEFLELSEIQKSPSLNALKLTLENTKKSLLNSKFSDYESFKNEIKILDERIDYIQQQSLKQYLNPEIMQQLSKFSNKDFYKEYSDIVKNSDKLVFDTAISIKFKHNYWTTSDIKKSIWDFSRNFNSKFLDESTDCLIYLKSHDFSKFKDFLIQNCKENNDFYEFKFFFKPIIPFQQEEKYETLIKYPSDPIQGLELFIEEDKEEYFHYNIPEYFDDPEYMLCELSSRQMETIHLFNNPIYFNENIPFYNIQNLNTEELKQQYILKLNQSLDEKPLQKLPEIDLEEQKKYNDEFKKFSNSLNLLYLDILAQNIKNNSEEKANHSDNSLDFDTALILDFLHNKQDPLFDSNSNRIHINEDTKKFISDYLECIKKSPDHIFDIIIDYKLSSNTKSLILFLEENNMKYDMMNKNILMKITDLDKFFTESHDQNKHLYLCFIPPKPYKKTIDIDNLSNAQFINSILKNDIHNNSIFHYEHINYSLDSSSLNSFIEKNIIRLVENINSNNVKDFSPNINTRNKNKP